MKIFFRSRMQRGRVTNKDLTRDNSEEDNLNQSWLCELSGNLTLMEVRWSPIFGWDQVNSDCWSLLRFWQMVAQMQDEGGSHGFSRWASTTGGCPSCPTPCCPPPSPPPHHLLRYFWTFPEVFSPAASELCGIVELQLPCFPAHLLHSILLPYNLFPLLHSPKWGLVLFLFDFFVMRTRISSPN